MVNNLKRFSLCIGTFLFLIVLSGCVGTTSSTAPSGTTLEPLSQKVSGFDDIELPHGMKYESDKTMSVKNRAFKGGVFYYKGGVDVSSLKTFIEAAMQNNMWQNDGESTLKKSSLMIYTKAGKTCLFIIDDEMTTTRVTVVVSSGSEQVAGVNHFPPNN